MMTKNQALTAGAVGFAVFALWAYLKQPAAKAGIAASPGQQQRDIGLNSWIRGLNRQESAITNQALGQYETELRDMGVL